MKNLENVRVAILVADGFEQSELEKPLEALKKAGATVEVVSPVEGDTVRGWKDKNWGDSVPVDRHLKDVAAADFDALVLPGGVMNPDQLRNNQDAVDFVKSFFEEGKPVGAICHGPWILVDADVLRGRRVTSYSSIKNDLLNAGALWCDEEVVVDEGLVTSRKPADLPSFNAKIIEEFAEGLHLGQRKIQLEKDLGRRLP